MIWKGLTKGSLGSVKSINPTEARTVKKGENMLEKIVHFENFGRF